jgi:hypothetical protein
MKIDSYKCDGCGKMKGETNHWWLIEFESGIFTVFCWLANVAQHARAKHICSQACAIRVISEWMGAQ